MTIEVSKKNPDFIFSTHASENDLNDHCPEYILPPINPDIFLRRARRDFREDLVVDQLSDQDLICRAKYLGDFARASGSITRRSTVSDLVKLISQKYSFEVQYSALLMIEEIKKESFPEFTGDFERDRQEVCRYFNVNQEEGDCIFLEMISIWGKINPVLGLFSYFGNFYCSDAWPNLKGRSLHLMKLYLSGDDFLYASRRFEALEWVEKNEGGKRLGEKRLNDVPGELSDRIDLYQIVLECGDEKAAESLIKLYPYLVIRGYLDIAKRVESILESQEVEWSALDSAIGNLERSLSEYDEDFTPIDNYLNHIASLVTEGFRVTPQDLARINCVQGVIWRLQEKIELAKSAFAQALELDSRVDIAHLTDSQIVFGLFSSVKNQENGEVKSSFIQRDPQFYPDSVFFIDDGQRMAERQSCHNGWHFIEIRHPNGNVERHLLFVDEESVDWGGSSSVGFRNGILAENSGIQ